MTVSWFPKMRSSGWLKNRISVHWIISMNMHWQRNRNRQRHHWSMKDVLIPGSIFYPSLKKWSKYHDDELRKLTVKNWWSIFFVKKWRKIWWSRFFVVPLYQKQEMNWNMTKKEINSWFKNLDTLELSFIFSFLYEEIMESADPKRCTVNHFHKEAMESWKSMTDEQRMKIWEEYHNA